jgi:hypothetical protein
MYTRTHTYVSPITMDPRKRLTTGVNQTAEPRVTVTDQAARPRMPGSPIQPPAHSSRTIVLGHVEQLPPLIPNRLPGLG